MTLSELRDRFNEFASVNDLTISMIDIKTPEELMADVTVEWKSVAGGFMINEAISGIAYMDGEDVSGIELITVPDVMKGAAQMHFVVAVLIEVFAGLSRKRRDKLIEKLGLNNNTWVKGSEVTEGEFNYRVFRRGDFIIFEVAPRKKKGSIDTNMGN